MNRLTVLKGVLWLWVVWHLVFGLLATFAPEIGGNAVGWTAAGGWDAELITMSTQYGMVMVLLAVMFLIMALDPLRYLGLVWVAVAEQVLGMAYAGYIYVQFGQLTIPQMLLQAGINSIVVIVFVLLWLGLRERSRSAPR
ncbi:MAG: hypothetical protein GVY32_05495 [Gammaproteobacteria bacterium]|jgi:hypothetical protein|nr:hypothetical protein [Gammaproteobacteria bacterium]